MEKKIEFEKELQRLDEIIAKISQNSDDLDESLSLYEEGKSIVKRLSAAIDEAKDKIEKVIK